MSDIMSFVKMAAENLNVSEDSAKGATGGVLDVIKGQLGEGDFSELLSKVPGAEGLLGGSGGGGGGGGMMGGLLGSAVSAIGGEKAAGAAGLISAITSSGIGTDQAGGFMSMLVEYLKKQAGEQLMGKILSQVPGLG